MRSVLVLAALVVVALLLAVFLLKKRTASKKAAQVKAIDQAETAGQARETALAPPEISPAERDTAVAKEGAFVVAQPAEEASGAQRSETAVSVIEPVALAAAEFPSVASEDEPVLVEPVAVEAFSGKETSAELEETSVLPPEGTESLPLEQEEFFEQLIVPQPEETSEGEPVSVMEAEAPGSEPVVEPQPIPVEETIDSVPEVGALPQVCLTIEAYSARLNLLEEKQRALLTQAMQRRDDKQRDLLQRELVLMNDKLALLADSYAAEMACYQQILAALERLQGDDDGVELAAAQQALREGEPQAAEALFARLSEQPHPSAAQAAFHSGQLAECRVDLEKALHLYRRAMELEPENPQFLQAAGKTARTIYRYKEALAWLESLVQLSREKKDMEPVDQALAQGELAYTYVLSGQHQKAGPLYKESMTTLAKILGQDHP